MFQYAILICMCIYSIKIKMKKFFHFIHLKITIKPLTLTYVAFFNNYIFQNERNLIRRVTPLDIFANLLMASLTEDQSVVICYVG